jgi:hypothetical protein
VAVILLFVVGPVKEALLPPFADDENEIAEDENAEDAEKKKIVAKKFDVAWFLLHVCVE